jgi:hypothetical protein
MTDEERENIAHMLGLELRAGKRRRWSFRNIWYGEDMRLDNLRDRGFVKKTWHGYPEEGPVAYYQVTDGGITAAGFDGRVRKEDRI